MTRRKNLVETSRRDALALFALPLFAGKRAAAESAPLTEVTPLMKMQIEAWNRGDIAGFCSYYADDCIFISPSGVTRGRQIVQEHYAKKYGAAKQTMGRLAFEILDTRPLPGSVSLAMRWSLTWEDKPKAAGLTLIVWQKQSAGWRLVQDASM